MVAPTVFLCISVTGSVAAAEVQCITERDGRYLNPLCTRMEPIKRDMELLSNSMATYAHIKGDDLCVSLTGPFSRRLQAPPMGPAIDLCHKINFFFTNVLAFVQFIQTKMLISEMHCR